MKLKSLARTVAALLPDAAQERLRRRYRQWRDTRKCRAAHRYDMRTYLRHSGLVASSGREALEACIIRSYHRIEKGLALREPRPGFGPDAVVLLQRDLARYLSLYGPDRTTEAALNTLIEYVSFNRSRGVLLPDLESVLRRLGERRPDHLHQEGGTREITRQQVLDAARIDAEAFFRSRHSIRQFSDQPVEMALIERAVALARYAPSVCNRQAGRVYVVADKARQRALLDLQNGNRGFGDQADKILIVTSSLPCFLTVGERYQPWIDGGLFAMALLFALHAQGLGTCCLNWSVEPDEDMRFRAVAGLPDNQRIMFLVAVGHLPASLRVAQSPRRPVEEVLHTI